ncbi:hypothetical protein PVAND_016476 [Polypedilum vanderplanki]|uniref:Uncharacterized protein n=1 Tax=Polypedilum vanderplanki TaxID=319348 RepID=A0A9J6BFP9_POLVA|nr:hypothetical protein PVAND_016476 [Polypedilum vanderplanki]
MSSMINKSPNPFFTNLFPYTSALVQIFLNGIEISYISIIFIEEQKIQQETELKNSLLCLARAYENNVKGIKVTKILCNSSNLTISYYKCWIRAYNRRSPTANLEFMFKRKTPEALMSIELFYTTNKEIPYKRSLHIENFEFCQFFKENMQIPLFGKLTSTIQFINSNSSYACNSTGFVKFHNLTFNGSPIFTVFPPGFHISTTRLFDKNDSNILNVTLWAVLSK